MMSAAIERFLKAIGYPLEEIGQTEGSVSLLVDEMTIEVAETRRGLILRHTLGDADEVNLVELAGYAAGRVLKDEATLAYDPVTKGIFVWQPLPREMNNGIMINNCFECFMTACEWWRAALGQESKKSRGIAAENMMRIMP